MILTCCGHSFCRGCSQRVRGIVSCPLCRTPLPTNASHPSPIQPNWFARQMINEVPLRCSYGKYRDKHAQRWMTFDNNSNNDCQGVARGMNVGMPSGIKVWSRCEPCTETVTVADRARHEASCPHAIIECPFKSRGCKYIGMRKDLHLHQAQCRPCPRCNQLVQAGGWGEHQKVCDMTEVCCRWEKYGCKGFRGPRKFLREHLNSCRFEAVAGTLEEMEERLAMLVADNARLANQCEQLTLRGGGAETQVFVKGPSGQTKVVSLNLEVDTGSVLYNKLERIYGIPQHTFMVVFESHRVESSDEALLRECGVKSESTLSMRHRAQPHKRRRVTHQN